MMSYKAGSFRCVCVCVCVCVCGTHLEELRNGALLIRHNLVPKPSNALVHLSQLVVLERRVLVLVHELVCIRNCVLPRLALVEALKQHLNQLGPTLTLCVQRARV